MCRMMSRHGDMGYGTRAGRGMRRGVHFFRPVPKEYLHSAELRDIMQFGSSSAAVFFKMRVAGVLHVFQFDTRQACLPAAAPLTPTPHLAARRCGHCNCIRHPV